MLLKEIRLQTNHLLELYNFYKEILELPTAYSNRQNSIAVTAGKSQLIFEETNKRETLFIISHLIFLPINLRKHFNG